LREAGHGVCKKRIPRQKHRIAQPLTAPCDDLIHFELRNGAQLVFGRVPRGLHLGAVKPCAAGQQDQHCRRQNKLYPAREYCPILLHHFCALKTGCKALSPFTVIELHNQARVQIACYLGQCKVPISTPALRPDP